MKARDYFDLVLKIILILLGILIIIWILQLLFGGSPGLEEFNFALILLLAGLLIQLYREVGVIKNDMKHNFSNIKNSFINIKEDMNLIKNKLKIK
ncbi:hypothetical protein J4221_05910 [Candidatus Pacearchaeota archaeon]|nr:hypothetical protein [Candidatus Pacearchaeota archaeon]